MNLKKIHSIITLEKWLVLLSLAYVLIETQAIIFAINVFTSSIEQSQLTKYERFGYSSAGIGVTLLMLRLFASKEKKHQFLLVLATAPLLYIGSVWALYELVHKAPSGFTHEAKAKALNLTVDILTKPHLKKAFHFYTNDDAALSVERFQDFVERFPVSDTAISKTYHYGFSAINQFSDYYRIQVLKLDHDKISKALFYKSGEIYNADDYYKNYSETAYSDALISSVDIWNPIKYPEITASVIAKLTALKEPASKESTILINALDSGDFYGALLNKKNYLFYTKTYEAESDGRNKASYKAYLEILEELEVSSPVKVMDYPSAESIKNAIVKDKLSKYTGAEVHVPWPSDRNIFNDDAYVTVTQSIAPFLYSVNGEPLIGLDKLRNDRSYQNMVDGLNGELNLRYISSWKAYRVNSLYAMSQYASRWENDFNDKVNQNLVRVSTILPLMLCLSIFLLLANLALSFKQDKMLGGTMIIIVVLTCLLQGLNLDDLMLELILPISIHETQMFNH